MSVATAEKMIPESAVNRERRFWMMESEALRRSDSLNFQDSIRNLRKARELGLHLIMSLMVNIVMIGGFIGLTVIDKPTPLWSKIFIVICFALLGSLAAIRLVMLVKRGE